MARETEDYNESIRRRQERDDEARSKRLIKATSANRKTHYTDPHNPERQVMNNTLPPKNKMTPVTSPSTSLRPWDLQYDPRK